MSKKMLGDLMRQAQKIQEEMQKTPHLHFLARTVLGFRIHHRKQGVVRMAGLTVGQALGAEGVAGDVQMRVIDGVVLVGAGGQRAERPGVDDFPAPEAGLEGLAVASTSVDAPRTDTRDGRNTSRAVRRLGRLIGIGL